LTLLGCVLFLNPQDVNPFLSVLAQFFMTRVFAGLKPNLSSSVPIRSSSYNFEKATEATHALIDGGLLISFLISFGALSILPFEDFFLRCCRSTFLFPLLLVDLHSVFTNSRDISFFYWLPLEINLHRLSVSGQSNIVLALLLLLLPQTSPVFQVI